MFLKVIYPDGTLGRITPSILGSLSKSGKIIAYESAGGWVEVRRKQHNKDYFGPERRKSDLPLLIK